MGIIFALVSTVLMMSFPDMSTFATILCVLGCAVGAAFIIDSPMIVFLVGGMFVLETVSDILQVGSFKLRHKRIFKMAPIHHHFEKCGWKENKIVIVFSAVTV